MEKKESYREVDRRTFIKKTIAGATGIALYTWGVPTLLKASTEPIKIGCIYPLTGPMIGYGLPTKASMEYSCEKLNASGGIMGRKVIPIIRDEQLSPEVTVRHVKDLILSEGCKIVGGCISSADSLAASMVVRDMKGKGIWSSYCASSSKITEESGHRYVFRIAVNTTAWSRSMAIATVKRYGNSFKRIYCINPDMAFGHSVYEEFKRYWSEHAPQAQIVGEAWPPIGCTDFTSYITAILGAKPDLIEGGLYGGDATIFFKQASAYGLLKRIKYAGPDIGLMAFLNNLKKGDAAAPIGALAATHYPFYQFEDEENIEFYNEVHRRSGWYPDAMGYTPPMLLKFLKYAMEKIGSSDDVEGIVNILEEGVTLDTFIGKVQLRGCDHQAMMPLWVGELGWDPKGRFPMPILVEKVEKLDNYTELYHSCDEVKKIREEVSNNYWYKS